MKATTSRSVVLATATLLIVMLATAANADAQWGQRFGRHGQRGGGPSHGRAGLQQQLGLGFLAAAERLELTEEQQEQLKKIRRSAPSTLMPKMQAAMEAQMELRDLMDGTEIDKAKLQRAHQQVQDARSALASAKFELRLEALTVLTAEQRKELQEQRRRGRGDRTGQRAPRGRQRGFAPDADRGF